MLIIYCLKLIPVSYSKVPHDHSCLDYQTVFTIKTAGMFTVLFSCSYNKAGRFALAHSSGDTVNHGREGVAVGVAPFSLLYKCEAVSLASWWTGKQRNEART